MQHLAGLLAAVCLAACSPSSSASAVGDVAAPAAARKLKFNAVALDARGLQVIAQLESFANAKLPDGEYWYDPRSGASGPWGGGVFVVLPPNLPLGGPLRPESSGGGKGQLTNVFVNGRELHPNDVAAIGKLIQVVPGRYWVDAQGNVGQEGGPVLFNFYTLAKQASGKSHESKWAPGTTWSGGGANQSTWGSDGGRITNHCSYDPSDGAGVLCSKTQKW